MSLQVPYQVTWTADEDQGSRPCALTMSHLASPSRVAEPPVAQDGSGTREVGGSVPGPDSPLEARQPGREVTVFCCFLGLLGFGSGA